MSQEGVIDIIGTHPEIPILFIANVGSAIPIANTLELLGEVVAAGTHPFRSIGSGNTITYQAQIAQAIASTNATNIGLSAYNSSQFSVDANGFVSLNTGSLVTSVTGTVNRITATPTTGNVVVDIAATYVGQTSITTLGTIATGTWSATNIALNKGGTNASLTASVGGIFYSTASAGAILSGTGTAGQHLQSGASAAPSWTTATFPSTATGTGTILRADGTNWVATTSTYPNTNAANTLLYASSANVMSALATANNGVLFTDSSGIPSIGKAPILVGGTNASSFTQANGIVTYNGTSLVNYAGPQLSSGGIMTNTSQPAFYAFLSVADSNKTGDGTVFTVGTGNVYTISKNQGTNFVNTGTFTAPVTGLYQFFGLVGLSNMSTSFTGMTTRVVITGTSAASFEVDVNNATTQTYLNMPISVICPMTAGDTAVLRCSASGSTKTVGLFSGVGNTTFAGYLVC